MSTPNLNSSIKTALSLFAVLVCLTLVSVGISYSHLSLAIIMIVILALASFKSSLVACKFMHLKEEKRWIYVLLGLTVVFFIALLLLPMLMSTMRLEDYYVS